MPSSSYTPPRPRPQGRRRQPQPRRCDVVVVLTSGSDHDDVTLPWFVGVRMRAATLERRLVVPASPTQRMDTSQPRAGAAVLLPRGRGGEPTVHQTRCWDGRGSL